MSASRVINGTYGHVWEDGLEMADVTACQGKVSANYQPINQCGQIMEDRKLVSAKGTGSLTVNHVYTRGADTLTDIMKGHDRRKTIVTNLADPDSWGYERVAYYGVSYDEVTLTDFAAAKAGTITIPFAFTSCEFLDKIEVR